MKDTLRVYVADLAAYNSGNLRGEWFDTCDYASAEDFSAAVKEYIEKVPGREEWAIHDYENAHGTTLREHESFEDVWDLGKLLEKHGEAFGAYAGHVGREYATAEAFEDDYRGEYESGADYAESTFDDSHDKKVDMSTWPYNCIDWERAWSQLENDGYRIVNGHVFSP